MSARTEATEPVPAPPAPEAASPGIEALVREFQAPLIRHARRLVRDEELAQDAVQESFLRYLRKPPAETDPRRISTWLHRVTHNLCVDWIRKEVRMRTELETMEPPAPAPPASAALIEEQSRERIEALMERLTANQRVVLQLKVFEGKSYKEIGEITGFTTGNVGYHIYAGLKRLGALLREGEVL